jgi:hypothetical protein
LSQNDSFTSNSKHPASRLIIQSFVLIKVHLFSIELKFANQLSTR